MIRRVMEGLSDKDQAIVAARRNGELYRKIGERYGVSRSRTQSIVSKHDRKKKAQARAEELRKRIRAADDLDKKCPTEFLLEALALPWLPNRAIQKWVQETGAAEISLRDILDHILPENAERGPRGYPKSPFTKQPGVGRKTYKALTQSPLEIDFGGRFEEEWEQKK